MGILAVVRVIGTSLGKGCLLSFALMLHNAMVCPHTIHQGMPWGIGESPGGFFFVPLHKPELVSLPVGADSHQTS